jgi:hypothetical protein
MKYDGAMAKCDGATCTAKCDGTMAKCDGNMANFK